jgi:hypothetical protein
MLSLRIPQDWEVVNVSETTPLTIPQFLAKHANVSSIAEMVAKFPDGIPLSFKQALDADLHVGNRMCDTVVQAEMLDGSTSNIQLRKVLLPDTIWQADPKTKTRAAVGKTPVKESWLQSFLSSVTEKILNEYFLETGHLLDDQLKSYECRGEKHEFDVALATLHHAIYSRHPKGLQECFKRNFLSLLFRGGPNFGRSEINITAVQRKILLATKGQRGLRETDYFATTVLHNLINPIGFIKGWKAVLTNVEKTEFGYIGLLPCASEAVPPEYKWIQELYNSCRTQAPQFSDTEYEEVLEVLAYFTSTREFANPDKEDALSIYVNKYVPMLTKDRLYANQNQFDIDEMEELYSEAKSNPLGKTELLSRMIAKEVIAGCVRSKDRNALERTITSTERLSGSADFDHKRVNHGHYECITDEVIPWMKEAVSEHFNILLEEESEDGSIQTFVATDFGIPICSLELAHLPIWQAACRTTEVDEQKFLEQLKDGTQWNRVGLDGRLGTIVYLWSQVKARPWIEIIDDPDMDPAQRATMSIEELRDLVKERGYALPKERCVPVCEPGGKVRWVSCAEAALLFFQQPLAETLRDIYAKLQGCDVGLQQSDHLFRFEKSFADHFLDDIINRRAGTAKITPQEVSSLLNLKNLSEDELLDNHELEGLEDYWLLFQKPGGLDALMHVRVAEALSVSYGVPLLSALYSTYPRLDARKEIPAALLLRHAQLNDTSISFWAKHLDVTYETIESRVENNPELYSQVVVISTNDQMSATDTLNHQIGHRNLSTLLGEIGYTNAIGDRIGETRIRTESEMSGDRYLS